MIRKKGDGSFRKLPNGSVEFTVDMGNDIYGARQRKRFYGKTESECRKKYKEFLKEGEKQPIKSKEHTLSAWLDEWLKIYKEKKVQSSTHEDYVYLASHIKKHKIGSMKLSQIKPIHITGFFSDKSKYSQSFFKRMRFLLNGAFESAVDNDFCNKNPVRRAEIAKKTQPQKEAFSEDDVKKILDFAKTDDRFGLVIFIMLHTGIRSGEMRALTVDKIDFNKGIVTIDTAVKRHGVLGSTKSGKPRLVPLNPEVAQYLSEKIDKNSRYIIGDDEFVSQEGFRSRYHWFFSRLNKHLESMDMEPIDRKSPHATRHTAATLWHKNGMPLAMVSELLGHHSTEVTDKYTHVNDVRMLSEAVKQYGLPA